MLLPETMDLRGDAHRIINAAIAAALPGEAVRAALEEMQPGGRITLVAVGKAAWEMAAATRAALKDRIRQGIVITKYGHSRGALPGLEIHEAGHPVPDESGFRATRAAIDMCAPLGSGDTVLFLLSGGGSALFEKPLVPSEEMRDITRQLLACGADICQINTLRKRLSGVKGGKFAQICAPARVQAVILSDVLGDRLDAIASGPAVPDPSTGAQAMEIAERYGLRMSAAARALLQKETPKALQNVETRVIGSVRQLCACAEARARELGYRTQVLATDLCCTARDAGSFLAAIARQHAQSQQSLAFICGGETLVRLTGAGLGGRNQELALAAAEGIAGLRDTAVFSVGSDGTDGPTDAAGGYVDGTSFDRLRGAGIRVERALEDNDSYHALERCGGLIVTGPTGTNVNDLSVLLIRRGESGAR